MLTRTLITALLLVGAFSIRADASNGCSTPDPQQRRCPEPPKSPFRYVITYKDQMDYIAPDDSKQTVQVVEVLLDPKSFSEGTLGQLFGLLSKRFSTPKKLFVHVHTNLEDVYTPEEAEQIVPPSKCDILPGSKFPWAIYTRTDEYEGFNYGTNEPGGTVRTVKLRDKVK
jgi:hypothetical protein